MLDRLGVSAALVAIWLSLSGFGAVSSISGSQQDVAGDLGLTVTACKVDLSPFAHTNCAIGTNTGEYSDVAASLQLLLAFRVQDGVAAPDVFMGTTNDAPARELAFRRNAGYEAELTRLVAPEAGRRWIGYLSDQYSYTPGGVMSPARQVAIAGRLSLPRAADGAPFFGPLQVTTVLGRRAVSLGARAGRPVACGASPYAASGDATVCVDWPLASGIGGFAGFTVRDFGIVAGNATASAGQTVSLPFGVRGAGPLPAGLTASLSASTTLPGASPTPSLGSAPLGNGSDTRVTVPVAVPANAAAGTYEVALTGRLENGQERRGVGQLTVRARPVVPDTKKPQLSKASVRPKRFKPATRRKPKRGTDVRFTLSEAATVKLTVERCSKRAGKRRRGPCLRFKALKGAVARQGKAGANVVRFDGRLRGKGLRPGAYRLVVSPTDAAGNRGAAVKLGFAIAR